MVNEITYEIIAPDQVKFTENIYAPNEMIWTKEEIKREVEELTKIITEKTAKRDKLNEAIAELNK